jgi:hypothetical protein
LLATASSSSATAAARVEVTHHQSPISPSGTLAQAWGNRSSTTSVCSTKTGSLPASSLLPCCFLQTPPSAIAIITRDYNGQTFSFRDDGYFNMTKAAKVFGKEAKHFWSLPSTVEYLEALHETVGKSDLYEARPGRNGGTWGHPKLAVFFARWLDVKFAVFCDTVIDDILNKKAEHLQIGSASRMFAGFSASTPRATEASTLHTHHAT